MATRLGWTRVARATAALGLAGGLAFAGTHVAGAQTGCQAGHAGIPEDCVTTTTDPGTTTTVQRPRDPGSPPSLAFTGGDMLGLAVVGGAATAVGVALVASGRRRRYPALVVVKDRANRRANGRATD
jgi:hypothetical protein